MKSKAIFGTQSIPQPGRSLIRCAIGLMLGLAMLLPQVARADDNKLRFFKNYFVTGDYTVAGVGLRGQGVNGFATANINMTSVPAGADPIAAFLYWQTVETTLKPSSANGFFRSKAIVGLPIGDLNNPGCWSQGGTDGPNSAKGRVYRADVLRYLAIDPVNNVRIANGLHSVKLPDGGGNSNAGAPFANGATLVVIYRIVVPGNPTAIPLRAIVIYDGAFSMSKKRDDFTQTLKGFYQASGNSNARLTAIVGNGQPGYSASLAVNGKNFNSNVFVGAQGSRWDNPSFSIKLDANASSVDVAVAGENTSCLTWGAMIASTNVVDTDWDGLLDVWETSGLHFNPGNANSPATFGGCSDYSTDPCVNLPMMGAVNGQKDLFVEIDWLQDANHTHKPKLDALLQVATAFKNGGSGGNGGVRVHFDVGDNYQSFSGPDKVFVPSAYAQGGERIEESSLRCTISPCTYSEPYSVLSFKKGFSGVRDGYPALNIPRHFSRLRKDIFHYTLFAHALSSPIVPNAPLGPPKTISGVADRPGADLMITLGLWRSDIPANDQVGSTLVQAGTLMHELGHNLGLSHAGNNRTPNCMPNYPSVMNYLYQTRGLSKADNSQAIDFSPGTLGDLNENALSETSGLGALKYKIRYYGPLTALDPPNSGAKVHCDGSPVTSGGPMVRLENNFPSFIDWNHDGAATPGTLPNDINFSGPDGVNASPSFRDSNDWASLNLQQIGARLNVNGLSTDVGVNDLGVNDLGVNDLGVNDLGVNDLGVNDLGVNDLGVNDLGAIDAGDVDYETAILSTIDSPPGPSPDCPTCGVYAVNKIDRVTLSWTAPATGSVASYNIYRIAPGSPLPIFIKNVTGLQATGTADDIIGATTLYNVNYTYFVTSVVSRAGLLIESGPSNTANGIIKRLYITAQNAARLYLDPNPTLFTITGLDLPAPAGSDCTTTATQTSDAGTYPIICSGPATTASAINGIVYTNGVLTINPRPQAITFDALAQKTYLDPDFLIAATATSNLAVTFGASGNCSVNGNSVKITGAGGCTITAQQAGNKNYLAAPGVPQFFVILKAPQTITFAALAGKTFGGPAFPVSATTTSTLTVSFTASGNCTIAGVNVTITGAGSCIVSALQAGNANYLPATSVPQSFAIAKSPQTITLNTPASKTFGDATFSVTASSTSLLGVEVAANGNCSLAANLISITGAGTCTVTATQGGNVNYLAASVTQSFAIAPRQQTITFASLANKTLGDSDFTVGATSDSGLPVVFSATGNCTIVGNLVHLAAAGTCTITASVDFNPNYLTATPVASSFTIAPNSTLNVLWYTGGVGTTTASGVIDYQTRIAALGATAASNSPNRPWNIVFWASGSIPAAPSGGWNVLVVASNVGGWSTFPTFTDLQTAIGNESVKFDPAVNRVMLTGIDADWHYLNSPGTLRGFNGPPGFLLNSINWAGSGTGMGLVQLGTGGNFSFSGFSLVSRTGENITIPVPQSGYPINAGLSGAGLTNWGNSSHSEFGSSFAVESQWTGLHLEGSSSTTPAFVTIVSAPFASGALKP